MKSAKDIGTVAAYVLLAAGLMFLVITALDYLIKPKTVIETPAPAVVQKDGSTVVERAPDQKAKPEHVTPKKSKLNRKVKVVVQGPGIKLPDGKTAECPPVTVDLSLVDMPDRTKRVVASSPDGKILRAVDIPVAPAPAEPKRWAAGLSWGPQTATAGVWVERDIGRVRLGAEINQTRLQSSAPTGHEVRLRVGMTF